MRRRSSLALAVCLVCAAPSFADDGRVVIREIFAAGSSDLADADGERSDWIELHNPGPIDVLLDGWSLSDDPLVLGKWQFPAVVLPSGAYLTVFASGKNRADPSGELHANFKLDSGGEFLALVRPDGATVADALAPRYPPQRPGLSFGDGVELLSPPLVAADAPARVLVPSDGALERRWTGAAESEPFDDSDAAGWSAGRAPIGYDRGSPSEPPLVFYDFNDASDPARAVDASGRGRDGRLTSHLALAGSGPGNRAIYTADGGGRSGQSGDRAADFGQRGDGAVVAVDAARAGAFDSAVANNAITISLWLFGSAAQPDNDVVFWGSSNADGTGTRSLNAHVPWGDAVVYWDTSGCCDGTQRISKPEPDPNRWRGRWNHYVFIKDGPTKSIWQNGALFHEGQNTARLTAIRGLFIGCAVRSGEWGYGGRIDDFAIWDRALSAAEIRGLAAGASPLSISSFGPLLGTDLDARMHGVNASVYARVPFTLDAALGFDALYLRMRFDAGFAAYLNGVEVARRAAPPDLRFDARATSARPLEEVLTVQDFDISEWRALLLPGANVLAIHGLNDAADSPIFFMAPELVAARSQRGRFHDAPSPGRLNGPGVAGFVGEVRIGVEHGFFEAPFEVEISCETPGAEIYYTLGGATPAPGAAASRLYTGPISISRTTVLRAAALKDGFLPSPPESRTYLFVADVAGQPARPAGLPASWSGGAADYEVDPDVVRTALPGYSLEEALLDIPSVSIVMDPADLFLASGGIYYHSQSRWEKPGSVELIHPDGSEGFTAGAGIRIHGYTSRDINFTPKHSFRVTFKSQFGPAKLEEDLFADSEVDRFDQFVLRGMSTDSWPVMDGWASPLPGVPRWWRERSTYLREQWMKDAQLAMGQLSSHARFVHLYLNGLYWGLYHLTERPTESFLAEHLGGQKEDFDVLKDFAELHGGTLDAWNSMMAIAAGGLTTPAAYQRLQGNNADGTRNTDLPRLLDLDNLIDYMIVHIFAGADDWPNHNWWAGRRRGLESEGFRFFAWDQEITNISLVQTMSSWGVRFEEAGAPNTPSYVYSQLRSNVDFRRRFGDRVQKHLFGAGALTPAACDARWSARAAETDKAMVAESARWGDSRRAAPYKREVEWLRELAWMRDRYWIENHPIALERFRRVGLYPSVAAPSLSRWGGRIRAGDQVAIAAPAGIAHATLDGSDPRAANNNPSASAFIPTAPLSLDRTVTLKARSRLNGQWSALVEAFFFIDAPLRITELMYHPRDSEDEGPFGDDDFEFIEIENVGAAPVALAGFKLEGAVRFDFASGSIGALGAGEILVLPRNLDAFAARYSTRGLRIPGAYDGELGNAGERIVLAGPSGEPILELRYSDRWQPETDGLGPSLVAVDPLGDPESWKDGASWRPSAAPLGSPGRRDGEAPPGGRQRGGDINQDGGLDVSDAAGLLGYLFLDPARPLPCGESIDAPPNLAVLDANGDGAVNLADAVRVLGYLFLGGPAHALGVECAAVEGCPEGCGGDG
jgi:hypothetical protein